MLSEPISPRFSFPEFVAKFPPVNMPVTLGEDTHHVFSVENEPIPDAMIRQFILPIDPGPYDEETTEYIPCFAIDNTEQFIALVWWKAALLEYDYILATYTNSGQLIDIKVIAYTKVSDKSIRRAVATIDEEWEIFVAEGETSSGNDFFEPTTSHTYSLEIMSNGAIVI